MQSSTRLKFSLDRKKVQIYGVQYTLYTAQLCHMSILFQIFKSVKVQNSMNISEPFGQLQDVSSKNSSPNRKLTICRIEYFGPLLIYRASTQVGVWGGLGGKRIKRGGPLKRQRALLLSRSSPPPPPSRLECISCQGMHCSKDFGERWKMFVKCLQPSTCVIKYETLAASSKQNPTQSTPLFPSPPPPPSTNMDTQQIERERDIHLAFSLWGWLPNSFCTDLSIYKDLRLTRPGLKLITYIWVYI